MRLPYLMKREKSSRPLRPGGQVCQHAQVTTEFVDGNPLTHDGFTHVCPFRYAMTGIDISRTYFNCGS